MVTLPSRHTINVQTADGVTQLPFKTGPTLREILVSGGFAVRSDCGGNASCGQCQVHVTESANIPFTGSERLRLSAAQLSDGLRLACQLIPETDLHVSIQRPMVQMAWRPLRDDEYCELPRYLTVSKASGHYGVAIDLGTTHIRLTLWNLSIGERVAGVAGLNPQGSYGADVLMRLMEANRSGKIAGEICGLAVQAIAEAFSCVAAQVSINLCEIGKVLVVGNTAMLCLLADRNFAQLLQPENWTQRLDCQPLDTDFLRAAWGIGKDAFIRFISPMGGFIGSDILAGVIATGLTEQPAGSVLIDFGTNSEIVLWDGNTLHVTATAGGPAFEGCGISCGMQGETGAIYRVDQGEVEGFGIRVLGGDEPMGLCGSALVDAVAWLRRNGRLDKVGRFTEQNSEGFVLYEGPPRIILKHSDIDVLQRAKAAIGGGVHWLCRQAGLSLSDLRLVYACGAFGNLLDVNSAQQIGLLPPVAHAPVRLEGNTALAGCEALLLSTEEDVAVNAVLALSKVYNMAEDAGFESLFVENLYLQPMQE